MKPEPFTNVLNLGRYLMAPCLSDRLLVDAVGGHLCQAMLVSLLATFQCGQYDTMCPSLWNRQRESPGPLAPSDPDSS